MYRLLKILLFLKSLWLTVILSDKLSESEFPYHSKLDDAGDFQIFWTYDDDTITIQYTALSRGWAGLGFSPNGAMQGADIAVFWVDNAGIGYVSDRHGSENGYPPEDRHQDYFLISSAKNETHLNMTFYRRRNTCDPEDWPLTGDTTRVIYAKNDEVPIDKNNFKKHTIRSSKSLHFFDDRHDTVDGIAPEPGAEKIEFRMSQVAVPDNTSTLYWCQFQPVPKIENKKHIIKIEPSIDPENLDIVHHAILYICHQNVSKFLWRARPCLLFDQMDELTKAFISCQMEVFSGWGKGGQSYTYPDDIGFPIYNPNGDMVAMLEIHYDNSQLKKAKVDSSGLRLWVTDKLRPIEAGRATIARFVSPMDQVIPPKTAEFTSYAYCGAQCTTEFPKDGIKIIGGWLHTHLAGRKVRLLHFRNGTQLPNILADEHYDSSYQDMRRRPVAAVVLPGDELVVECVYDTSDRNTFTFGGLAITDEMCGIFVDYYPAMQNAYVCYSSLEKKELLDILRYTMPKQWTTDLVKKMQYAEINGVHDVSCIKQGPDTQPDEMLLYKQYGYPNVTRPLQPPPDPCAAFGPMTTAVSAATSTESTTASAAVTYKRTTFSYQEITMCAVIIRYWSMCMRSDAFI